MEATELLVFLGHGHALEVLVVANGLEIAAYEEEVDFVLVPGLELCDVAVDGVELAVAASLYGNLRELISVCWCRVGRQTLAFIFRRTFVKIRCAAALSVSRRVESMIQLSNCNAPTMYQGIHGMPVCVIAPGQIRCCAQRFLVKQLRARDDFRLRSHLESLSSRPSRVQHSFNHFNKFVYINLSMPTFRIARKTRIVGVSFPRADPSLRRLSWFVLPILRCRNAGKWRSKVLWARPGETTVWRRVLI